MTTIFVLKESAADERRVAATPETVRSLVAEGYDVIVEAGAGRASLIEDDTYSQAGATVGSQSDLTRADVVVAVQPPADDAIDQFKEGAILISFLDALREPQRVAALQRRKATAFAFDMLPRTSRTQPMDALTSQATIAGYLALLQAATRLPKLMPLLMLPAGVVRPARVVVLGAGVSGLQAVATARRLGAVVDVCDVRPKAREEVNSIGARFLDGPTDPTIEDRMGYAREVSPEFLQRQRDALKPHIAGADVVIATARVPGKKAPVLVSKEMVTSMRPGAVLLDLVAEHGGNCEVTPADKDEIVTDRGVVVLAPRCIASRAPVHASQLYAANVMAAVRHLFPRSRAGEAPRDHTREARIDGSDAVTAVAVVTHAGEITHATVAALLGVASTWPVSSGSPTVHSPETLSPASLTAAPDMDAAGGDAQRDDAALASDDDEAEATRRASKRASRRIVHGLSASPEEDATEKQPKHPGDDNDNADAPGEAEGGKP